MVLGTKRAQISAGRLRCFIKVRVEYYDTGETEMRFVGDKFNEEPHSSLRAILL